MHKSCLIRPNAREQYQNLGILRSLEPPLWLAILANYYENPIIIDMEADDLDYEQTINKIKEYDPQDIVIMATGSHPSAYIQQQQAMFDLERMIKKSGILSTITTYKTLSIDSINSNKPRWDLLPMHKYRAHNWHTWGYKSRSPYGVVYTSVGCPYNCEFCSVKAFYGTRYKIREITDVVTDFEILVEKYNINHFKIMDELFISRSSRVTEICNKLIEHNYDLNIWCYGRIDTVTSKLLEIMRKAGIKWIAYGIEHGNEEIRRSTTKGTFSNNKIREVIKMTKDNDIKIVGNYMFGFWEDNLDTMQQTFDFAMELQCEYANFYSVVAYPCSKLYEDMSKLKINLPKDYSEYAQMGTNFKPLPTKYLSNKEVLKFRDEAFIKYFTNIKYLAMIEKTFGINIVNDIIKMTTINLKRDLLNE